MSLVLYSPSEDLDLGNPLFVFPALADAVSAADGVEYPALWGITMVDDEPVSDEYVAEVRKQARRLLARAGDRLSPRAKLLLGLILDDAGDLA